MEILHKHDLYTIPVSSENKKGREDGVTPLIIVFDNIDHMEIEHTNHTFPKTIFDVISNYRMLLYEIFSCKDLPVTTCLLCLRDANFALVNRQIEEISGNYILQFISTGLEKVFQKRIEHVKKSTNDRVRSYLLSYFFEDDVDYTNEHFLPLFNCNYRKMVKFIENFTVNGHEQIIDQLILEKEQYKEDEDRKKKYIHRVRGYIYYFMIEYLRRNDYLNNILLLDDTYIPPIGTITHGKMNAGRILLTIIHNKSKYYYDAPKAGYNIPVKLYDLYRSYRKIFTNDEKGEYFFQCLSALFLCHTDNHCHLITFNNKEVFKSKEYNNFKSESELLKKAEQNDNSAIIKLNKIELIPNPAGYTYLNSIMRHYEFFSLKAKNRKPLFACMNLQGDKLMPEFMQNIENTYRETEACIDDLKKFIDNYPGEIAAFERSDYCFKLWEQNKNNPDSKPRLYLVRIIDTHINYIDSLRAYILETDVLKEKYKNKRGESGLSDFIQSVNNQLIEYLEKYVKLLENVSTAKDLMDLFNRNLIDIKRTSQYYIYIYTGQ
jgi:hypothetical protein